MTQPLTAANSDSGKPKLLDQVRNRCRLRHMALSTEQTYVNWIKRFILFHDKRHPLQMAAPEVTRFLTHLAVDGHVAASTQNQALSASLLQRHPERRLSEPPGDLGREFQVAESQAS